MKVWVLAHCIFYGPHMGYRHEALCNMIEASAEGTDGVTRQLAVLPVSPKFYCTATVPIATLSRPSALPAPSLKQGLLFG